MSSGIYKITCKVTGKFYIGSAKSFKAREACHFSKLKTLKHPNLALSRSYSKYGKDNLEFEVVENCQLEELIEKEQFYIDTLKPQYNMSPRAGSSLGRKHPPRVIEKIRNASIARKDLEVTKEALKIGHGWNRGKPFSSESRKKMSEAKPKKPIQKIDPYTGEIVEYASIRQATKEGFHQSHISECCRRLIKTHKGFFWKLIESNAS